MTAAIRFAHISDTHIMPDTIGRNQVALDHLGSIDDSGAEFVIHTGDLAAEPSQWAYRAYGTVMSRLGVPVYCVPGNHDVFNTAINDADAPWWAQLTIDSVRIAEYAEWVGPNYYCFNHKGVLFVGVNSQVIDSGLPEEPEQWTWLEQTLEHEGPAATSIVLFMHKPLFVGHPEESLDDTDFATRYCVIAPPGRDRLMDLIREHRVDAVLTGHLHTPLDISHSWPDGSVTRFITTGTSGSPSPMAIDTFGLAATPVGGVGYHLNHLDDCGLSAEYRCHKAKAISGEWDVVSSAAACRPVESALDKQGDLKWYDLGYVTVSPEWQDEGLDRSHRFAGRPNEAYYVRHIFEAHDEQAALYLNLDSDCAFEVYLNGTLLFQVEALDDRPPAWVSANRSSRIDGPRMALGLDQRIVRNGANILALRFSGFGGEYLPSTYVLRDLEPADQIWN